MKKYRLKQWYPSLGGDFKNGEKIIFWGERGCYVKNFGDDISLRKTEVENNPDFWELIEEQEPLFITEDGVEVFTGHSFIIVGDDFIKHKLTAFNLPYTQDFKKFKHESNADRYIWQNKRVFSYEDMMKAKHSILITNEDIEKSAKERIEEKYNVKLEDLK